MKIKCLKCGFEDDGNFCSNCGSPLPQSKSIEKQTHTNVPEKSSWLDKCPVCQFGILSAITKKKLFGLVTTDEYKCANCGATFARKEEKYKLFQVQDISNTIWQDYGEKRLTSREWKNIAYGGMSDYKQKEVDLETWMTELNNGNIPISMSNESPIMLKKNEELQLALPNISLFEPRSIRTGAYGGPSIRVAKGVSFRVGGFKAESHEELRNIDNGSFTLTNKRLVFSGVKRTINIDLRKIISIDPYSDSIALRREGKQKTQYFVGINQAEVTIKVEDREYLEALSGLILMYMIEGINKRSE